MERLKQLLLLALEHERGGVTLYEAAISCAGNPELKKEWIKYLGESREHVRTLERVCQGMGLDTETDFAGRRIVAMRSESLRAAIEQARTSDPAHAQIVAAECVTLAETQDHLHWELIGEAASALQGEARQRLVDAYDTVEDQEDEHLYHTKGWCRELWLESLGLEAMLPPPEEQRHVRDAIAAARADQSRKH